MADDEPAPRDVSRRTFLRVSAIVGLAAAAGIGIVTLAQRGTSGAVDAIRSALQLPKPTDPAAALSASVTPSLPGLAPAITANSDFYQIDVAMTVPVVDVDTWQLTIDGLVDAPMHLTFDQLTALPSMSRYITLNCVSNPVGGDLVGTALWQGVRLTDLLASVGVHPDADLVLGKSVDGFTAGFPRALLDDGRDAMVAYAMNGEPLPAIHGFPVRLVVPGLYGYVSATKWLSQIKLTTLARDVPFWFSRGWSTDGRVESASRIDVPHDGTKVAAGPTAIGGRAWHQHTAVGAVQISIDEGPWQDTTLADKISVDTWRLWSFTWDATPGKHQLRVRVIDGNGTAQSEQVRDVLPGASSGLHTITISV